MSRKDFSLSSDEIAQFERDGYIGPFDLYDPAEMEQDLRALRPKLISNKTSVYSGEKQASTISNYDRHLDIDFLARHVTRPEIVDRVASLLGPDTLCWRSEFLSKYPGDEGTDWHQADEFAGFTKGHTPQIQWPAGSDRRGTITVWTAFTEATVENGALQVMPGTHREMYYDESKNLDYDPAAVNRVEKQGTHRGFYGYDYRQLQKDPNWVPDESEARSAVMKQGQFVIFWSTLMHASHPNTSADQTRLGYSVRYLPTEVRVYPGLTELQEFGSTVSLDRYGTVLTSGEDTYQHNRFVQQTVNGFPFPVRQLRRSA